MNPQTRLRTLAVIADGEQRGLIEAVEHYCPDWIPSRGNPGIPNREYTATRDPRWRKVSILVAHILTRQHVSPEAIRRLAETFTEPAASGQTATSPVMPRRSTRDRTKRRWTVPQADEHINEALNCGDPEIEKTYLFATGDELASMIGCNRKTAMETKFWTEDRDEKQQAWRRQHAKPKQTRKRDI